MKITKFNEYHLNEGLDDELKDLLSNTYKSFKRGVIAVLVDNLKDKDSKDELIALIGQVLKKGTDNIKLNGFIETSDIVNLYLKYQNDIDELLRDENFFDITPSSNGIFSLYDYIIDGTKKSFDFILTTIEKELKK